MDGVWDMGYGLYIANAVLYHGRDGGVVRLAWL